MQTNATSAFSSLQCQMLIVDFEHHVSGKRLKRCFSRDSTDRLQRLKGAIDSRIAEEQAKLQQSQPSPSNVDSDTRRATSRTDSPNRRTAKPPPRARQDGDPGVKGPDPSSFEPNFVIEDGELSRSGTPAPMDVGSVADGKDGQKIPGSEPAWEAQDEATTTGSPRASHDIPTDVRVKLRKLEKLETRYQGIPANRIYL